MQAEELSRSPTQVPRWLVGVVVLVTGGITAWAMSMTRMRGPDMAWEAVHDTVEGAWGDPVEEARMVQQSQSWVGPAARTQDPVRQVAGTPLIPPIVAGAPRPHVDRGACANCHTIFSAQGLAVPTISSTSTMPHQYRGLCVNCHLVTVNGSSLMASPVAALTPPAASPPAPPPQPTEAEWMGLEVGPDPQGGALVKAAETTARRLGVQANDLVSSINGISIRSMKDFVDATQNGKLTQGVVIVVRNGQRLAFDFGQSAASLAPPTNATPAAYSPYSPYAAPPAGAMAPMTASPNPPTPNPQAPCPWGQPLPAERRF